MSSLKTFNAWCFRGSKSDRIASSKEMPFARSEVVQNFQLFKRTWCFTTCRKLRRELSKLGWMSSRRITKRECSWSSSALPYKRDHIWLNHCLWWEICCFTGLLEALCLTQIRERNTDSIDRSVPIRSTCACRESLSTLWDSTLRHVSKRRNQKRSSAWWSNVAGSITWKLWRSSSRSSVRGKQMLPSSDS